MNQQGGLDDPIARFENNIPGFKERLARARVSLLALPRPELEQRVLEIFVPSGPLLSTHSSGDPGADS